LGHLLAVFKLLTYNISIEWQWISGRLAVGKQLKKIKNNLLINSISIANPLLKGLMAEQCKLILMVLILTI